MILLSTKVAGFNENVTVEVGDWVCFKSDIEQAGRITKIERNGHYGVLLHLENQNGFSGHYIGGDTKTTMYSSDCWVE